MLDIDKYKNNRSWFGDGTYKVEALIKNYGKCGFSGARIKEVSNNDWGIKMSQEQINLRLRMTRRLKESGKEVQCEKCGSKWSPMIRQGGRMPNNWWVCPECGYDGDKLWWNMTGKIVRVDDLVILLGKVLENIDFKKNRFDLYMGANIWKIT